MIYKKTRELGEIAHRRSNIQDGAIDTPAHFVHSRQGSSLARFRGSHNTERCLGFHRIVDLSGCIDLVEILIKGPVLVSVNTLRSQVSKYGLYL